MICQPTADCHNRIDAGIGVALKGCRTTPLTARCQPRNRCNEGPSAAPARNLPVARSESRASSNATMANPPALRMGAPHAPLPPRCGCGSPVRRRPRARDADLALDLQVTASARACLLRTKSGHVVDGAHVIAMTAERQRAERAGEPLRRRSACQGGAVAGAVGRRARNAADAL